MLVVAHDARRSLATGRHFDGCDLSVKEAVGQGPGVTGLRGGSEAVAVGAAQPQLCGHVVGGLRHGVIAVGLAQARVGKAGADGTVEHPELASIGGFALAHDKGSAGHALDTTGDVEGTFANGDGAGGVQHGSQSAAAQPIDGLAGDADRQSGKQRGMAGHVAAVFTGLAGAAEQHVFHLFRLERTVGYQLADDGGGQVIRAHRGEAAALAAKGGAQAGIEIGIEHGGCLLFFEGGDQ